MLERAGYRALVATSARKAVEIFLKNHVDLVLTEQGLSTTLGGPTLAATMKRLKPDVPVLIYSADWAESPEDMLFADRFITKLVSIDELLCTIEKLLVEVRKVQRRTGDRASLMGNNPAKAA